MLCQVSLELSFSLSPPPRILFFYKKEIDLQEDGFLMGGC